MAGRGRMRGVAARMGVVAMAALLSGACMESGLPEKNRPYAGAIHAPPPYPLYEATESALYEVDGRRWLVMGDIRDLPRDMLSPIGTAGGTELLAASWDEAPYDRLYIPSPTGGFALVEQVY